MTLLRIEDLNIDYVTLRGRLRAVKSASLTLGGGEWLSIVGESGSGKSTLAMSIPGLLLPPGRITSGRIIFRGKDLTSMSGEELRRIRGSEIGVVFQDPLTSLDPLRTIGDQMAEAIMEHRSASSKREALEMASAALESVGIPGDRVKYYPHQLSGGQRQRVMIAMAVMLKPKLLIADEPTTALDVIVQANIMRLLKSLQQRMGMSVMLITHDIALAAEVSDRIAVMYAAEIVEEGPIDQVIENPLHPYTEALIKSTPDLWREKTLYTIPGNPPDLRSPPRGCRFHPRCHKAFEPCKAKEPRPTRLRGRTVACHLYG
ncbi:MAG: ABC transporter ATP-binding protein [Desulfurococcales archaeon]|nr:ABC transporter ATP-binding protein [Desulfurococcales archaeon]MCE4605093.1 ABC transporter ATP-binding protein [Desulfurococcales archaeon]